jgi:DUF3034 family protein
MMIKIYYKPLSKILIIWFALVCCETVTAADGKLLATPGISQIEGAAGGGIVPWAQLAGYASEDEIAANVFCSRGTVDDYQLDVCGAQANLFDRLELSFAKQTFKVDALNTDIEQEVFGAKLRLYGDLVYSDWPQISLGVQSKFLKDDSIAKLVGATDGDGTDWYVSASRLKLAAISGYNWLWNVTLRHTNANQIGLLGYSTNHSDTSYFLEASTAVLLNPSWAVGVEYRQKPNYLNLGEEDWKDIFVAWFPNKSFSLTAAYLDLGSIVGAKGQKGFYLSVTGYW